MEEHKMPKKELIHELESPRRKRNSSSPNKNTLIFTVVIMLILGVGTGYIASNVSGASNKGPLSINKNDTSGEIKKGFTTGVTDTKTFPDTAEGVLKEGGIEGEGEFHLERPEENLKMYICTHPRLIYPSLLVEKLKFGDKPKPPKQLAG